MRPFSSYLDLVKRERIDARYNLAGTTPVPPKKIGSSIRIDSTESPHSRANFQLIDCLENHLSAKMDQIAFTPGCSHAFTHVLAAVSSFGDTILVETPTYEPFLATARFLGLKIRRFQRSGNFDQDFKEIKAKSRGVRAILIANPACPTGHVYGTEELNQLADLGPTLIVDEIYLPLFDAGNMTRLIHPRSIHISGISKTTGYSSARVGWIRADKRVIQKVRRISTIFNVDMPTASLQIAAAALYHWKESLKPTLKTIRKNIQLSAELPAVERPVGSFFSVHVPKKFSSGQSFAMAMLKKGVWVRAGELFECPRTVRISLLAKPVDFKNACEIVRGFYD